MSNPNHTLIVMLLDASGSMAGIKASTIAGINTFITEQKNAAAGSGVPRPIDLSPDLSGGANLTCNLSMVAFSSINYGWGQSAPRTNPTGEPLDYDHSHLVIHDNVDIQSVDESWSTRYITDGGTPLIDAFCKCIEDTKRSINRMDTAIQPGRVIFVSYTDGEENTSKRFTRAQLNDKIKEQTEQHNWQFVFLGANQDAISEAQSQGVQANNSMTYAANNVGIAQAFAATTRMVMSKRLSSVDQMSNVSYSMADYASQDNLLGSNMNARHFAPDAGAAADMTATPSSTTLPPTP